ncbi:GNAT family N-acetyltransferase [Arthrobacter sp. NPDC093128]|uniref:GNAT family N-acetyltransferase n=1 Tax=Arthrobacter sp. NPDC093128 TaxID=3154979 RepID=UPI0034191213
MDQLHRRPPGAGSGDPAFSVCGDLPVRRRRTCRPGSRNFRRCHHLQDILVAPSFQGCGAGRAMLEAIQSRYGHVRQHHHSSLK